MSPQNKVEVEIFGEHYKLKGEASTEHMERIARYVDQTMHKVIRRNPRLTLHKAAVLTAINIADELLRTLDYSEDDVKDVGEENGLVGDVKGDRRPEKNHIKRKKKKKG